MRLNRRLLALVGALICALLVVSVAPALAATLPETPETGQATDVTPTTVVLNGVLNPHKVFGEAGEEYNFRYAKLPEGCNDDYETEFKSAFGAQNEAVSEAVTANLVPDTQYSFCLFVRNGEGEKAIGSAVTFTTAVLPPTRPAIDGESASAVNETEATLEARVNPNDQETTAFLQYSTSAAVNGGGALTAATPTPTTKVGKEYGDRTVGPDTLTGLAASTKFYYQAVASNATGTSYGAVQSFATIPAPFTDTPLPVGAKTATLNGHLKLDSAAPTEYSFDYNAGSECTGAGSTTTTPAEASTPAVSSEVEGLLPNTQYTVCLLTSNASGSVLGPPVSFKTVVGAPTVLAESESTTEVTSSSAKLEAEVIPNGGETTYRFEYDTTPYTGSTSHGTSTPESPSIGSDDGTHPAVVKIQGLTPATEYHYRAVATNEKGTEYGPDRTFTTQAAGAGFALPDGREWEMVTPPNKHGGALMTADQAGGAIQASEAGNAFTFITTSPIVEGPQGNRGFEAVQNLSRRGAGGWSTQSLANPHSTLGEFLPGGRQTEYDTFTGELSSAISEPPGKESLSPLQEGSNEEDIFVRDLETGSYTPVMTPANLEPGAHYAAGRLGERHFDGATADMSHVVFSSPEALTNELAEPTPGEENLYEWNAGAPAGHQLELVSVLPDGHPASTPVNGESRPSGLGDLHSNTVRGAISADGSHVIWSTGGALTRHIYMRDTVTDETETVQLDVPEPGSSGDGDPIFQGAQEFQVAGARAWRVYFLGAGLTTDSHGYENAPDLYVAEVRGTPMKVTVTDLTKTRGEEPADLPGEIIGFGENQTDAFVYYVADGSLTPGAIPGACTENSGQCSLYMQRYEDGTGEWLAPQVLATLSGADQTDWAHGQTEKLGNETARVSPNGRYLVFVSREPLTGYDNRDAVSGAREEEVFLFDAMTGGLRCVSCDPSGARPEGVYDPTGDQTITPLLNDSAEELWFGEWLSAVVPGWDPHWGNGQNASYQPRYLSDSGRVFFDSWDALVPSDVNGTADVYEYEPEGAQGGECSPSTQSASEVYVHGHETATEAGGGGESAGCVALISSGTGSEESSFLDASESGQDVFFMTSAQLVGGDTDSAYDVYDAHVCSGASPCPAGAGSVPPACSDTDSCRVAPAAQPAGFGAPSTATFNGAGNTPPVAAAVVKAKKRALTRAQKLAAALKACQKQPKHKRAGCRARAHKRFGAKKVERANRRHR